MNPTLNRNHRFIFYSAWLVIGLLQAAFTPLQDDEAYYWTFSRFLDWGYFDHPPMTALLIKMGYGLFQNELGVRLLIVLLSTGTVYLCELLTERKNPFLFYTICAVLAVLQLSGFMAVPDLPLLFFTALFFYVYRKFVGNTSLTNTVLLALVTAALLYSKYHAVLIIFFTLLSNFKLFTRWQTYAAGLLALALFVPHLWWQYQHDWISFRYHLFESNVNPYKISYTTDYILGQLLITGPLAGFILLPVLFRYSTKNLTEKAMKFTGIGVLVFFFLSTFKGRVEANWTAPMVVPILVLSHQYLLDHAKQRRWIRNLLVPTLLLVVLIRVVMIVDIVPADVVRGRFHQYHKWPAQLHEKTNGLPVALSSSYQKASQYWFYSGVPTLSVNQYTSRRSNYNFWPLEDSMLGKPAVLFVDRLQAQDSITTPDGMLYYAIDSSFNSFGKVRFETEEKKYKIAFEQSMICKVKAYFPPQYAQYLQQHPKVDAAVKVGVFDGRNLLFDISLTQSLRQWLQQPERSVLLPLNLPKGKYFLRFAVASEAGWFTHNSSKINVVVE